MKYTLEHINKYVKGQLIGNKDLLIEGVSEIDNSRPKTITFLGNSLYKKFLKSSNASAFLVSNKSFLDKNWNPTQIEMTFSKSEVENKDEPQIPHALDQPSDQRYKETQIFFEEL